MISEPVAIAAFIEAKAMGALRIGLETGPTTTWLWHELRALGLPHCTAYGLRKAGATRAAENGATEHQLMAMFGWDSPKQAALYTRKANRKLLATEAMHKLLPDQTENESVPPEGAVVSGGTIRGNKS